MMNVQQGLAALLLLGVVSGCNNEANDIPVDTDDSVQQESGSGDENSDGGNLNLDEATDVTGSLVGAVLKQGDIVTPDGISQTGNDFSFPDLLNKGDGSWVMVIKDEPIPNKPSRRELVTGEGEVAELGDTVAIRYDMFSWSTGELVDSTRNSDAQSLDVVIGDLVSGNMVPAELNNALLNRTQGTRLQVIFPQLMPDLPQQYNAFDAYILIVDIDEVKETPLESLPDIDSIPVEG